MKKQNKFIYKGKQQTLNPIYSFDGKYLTDNRLQEIVCTYTIFKIYEGSSAIKRHLVYCCDGKHLYRGPDFNSAEIVLTFDNTHIFEGAGFDNESILFTYTNNHIYKGNSNNPDHILYSMNQLIPECVLAIILMREGDLKIAI